MLTERRLGLAAAAVLLAAIWGGPTFYASVLATIGLYALLGLSLVLLGLSGQVSLGHAAFMGLAAYVSGVSTTRWDISPWLGIIGGVAFTAVVAVTIGLVTLRLRGHFLVLTTLAWGIALAVCFRAAGDLTGGASGLRGVPALTLIGIDLNDPRRMAVLIWLCVAGVTVAMIRLQNSRVGRACSAVRSRERMAETFGVPVAMLRLQAFVGSAAVAALAGGLYAHHYGFISPSPFELSGSIKALMVAVVGGELFPAGAIAGAFTIEGLSWMLQDLLPRISAFASNIESIVYGLVLILVMVRFHDGLWPLVERRLAVPQRLRPTQPLPARSAVKHPPGELLLQVDSVSMRFGGLQALDQLSLEVRRGEIVGLIGPNGAGKSTAFDVISGARKGQSGQVRLFGKPLPRLHEVAGVGLARSFQHPLLVENLPVVDNVMMGAYGRAHAGAWSAVLGVRRAEEQQILATALEALELTGISELAFVPISKLALGQRRLVEVARALAAAPELLLLDEPAAGLRHTERVALVRLLRKLRSQGVTILLVEHDMDLVMSCSDRLVVLDRGRKIADGPPALVRTDPAVVQAYLGGDAVEAVRPTIGVDRAGDAGLQARDLVEAHS